MVAARPRATRAGQGGQGNPVRTHHGPRISGIARRAALANPLGGGSAEGQGSIIHSARASSVPGFDQAATG